MSPAELETVYSERFHHALEPLANAIGLQLREYLHDIPRVDRVCERAKPVDSFLAKASRVDGSVARYSEPLDQIQDQVGVRIVGFYLSDVEKISKIVEKYYRPIETREVVPDSRWKFGYFGKHFILLIPSGLISAGTDRRFVPRVFELQIKTLFQHAWSEANHDLGYKPVGMQPGQDDERSLAFTSAQAWGADRIFDELHRSVTKSN